MYFRFVCFVIFVGISGIFAQELSKEPEQVKTSFTCQNREPGYYADGETGCRTYHICDGQNQFTYLCPPRTLFQSRNRICDHAYLVDCDESVRRGSSSGLFVDYTEDSRENSLNSGTVTETIESGNRTQDLRTTQLTTTTTTAAPPVTPSTSSPIQESRLSTPNVLKLNLKDSRFLFYIPEMDKDAVLAPSERQLVLQLEDNSVMKFVDRTESNERQILCPSRCSPRFLVPGTCHPCVIVK